MPAVRVYSNEYLELYTENDDVFLLVKKAGMSKELLKILFNIHSHIEFTSSAVTDGVLANVDGSLLKIGSIKKRIRIEIAEDEMKAWIFFNIQKHELDMSNREKLIKEVASSLKAADVVYGIKSDMFIGELENFVRYLVAEGITAQDGVDAHISMFELKEVKPEVVEDGKMDYYNLSLITIVDADTWLGEREEATAGRDGMTVTGKTIKAKKGVSFPLYYDREYVYEKKAGNKTVLYSKVYGAVYYKGRDISLMNPLIVDGDVDFKTGNIVFDGHVIIRGTICDGFYVEATNDIEVHCELGIGNIKGIVSRQGSIYIKGGIICKNNITIKAAKNIYVKFAENITMLCGGTLHVGFYTSNCTTEANEIIVDSLNGKLLGGMAKASTRIFAPIIGSELGKKTFIEVTGFNRELIKAELETLNKKSEALKSEFESLKSRVLLYSEMQNRSAIQDRILMDSRASMEAIREELRKLYDAREGYAFFVKTRGDGEVRVGKRIFPNTTVTIKGKTIEMNTSLYTTSFVYQGGKIIQL